MFVMYPYMVRNLASPHVVIIAHLGVIQKNEEKRAKVEVK